MKHRAERLGSLIQSELSKILSRKIDVPGALITITEVILSKPLDHATIMVSVFPSTEAEHALAALQKKTAEFRHLLIKKIPIRVMPFITFKLDRGPEKAAAIEKISIEEQKRNP